MLIQANIVPEIRKINPKMLLKIPKVMVQKHRKVIKHLRILLILINDKKDSRSELNGKIRKTRTKKPKNQNLKKNEIKGNLAQVFHRKGKQGV